MDGPGLGYSYQLPSTGWNLRVRNVLSQFSDLFSEFNKYIAPAYHHDRCERSVQMRLYSMHKREFVMVFVAFFACFVLAVFIGLAGPPITSTSEQRAHLNGSEVATGPFIMKTPLLSTYSQQLWVMAKLQTSNNDDERYDESFQISISIDGITIDRKLMAVLSSETGRNRTRQFKCERQTCEELVVAHLGFIDFSYYIITVRFHGLEGFHQRYNIRELTFYVIQKLQPSIYGAGDLVSSHLLVDCVLCYVLVRTFPSKVPIARLVDRTEMDIYTPSVTNFIQ